MIQHFLDSFSVRAIRRSARFQERIQKYHWDFYSALAYQRSQIADDLKKALLEAAQGPFLFSKWQRVVMYKYALNPLAAEGSLTDPGGRFNIGDIKPDHFSPFPALYIAKDKETALQEVLCQEIAVNKEENALDFALASPASVLNLSLSGSLDAVIDLTKPATLERFVRLIKNFTIPNHLIKAAREIKIAPPELVRTVPKLLKTLLLPDWRALPMVVDIPAASQIFGQLVSVSGIEGILYPSKFNGKQCLTIFPQNFGGSNCYVQLDDSTPPEVKIRRLDDTNFRQAGYGK